jgi:hypothetical protein
MSGDSVGIEGTSGNKMKRPSNLLSPVLAFVTASVFPLAVTGADNPPALQPVVTDTTSANKPPMVTQNPDGTMTVARTRQERAAPRALLWRQKYAVLFHP